MKPFETEELSDQELSRMLATWTVSVPSEELRTRIFSDRRTTATLWFPSFLATSTVEEPWYRSLFRAGRQSRSFAAALVLQMCALAFCLVTIAPPVLRSIVKQSGIVLLAPYRPSLPKVANKAGGGGGGGQHSLTPITNGEAPKYARKSFIPPDVAALKPPLPMVPTITAVAPQIEATNYGDPLSKLIGVSPGQGLSGLGYGKDGGLGQGGGTGYGPGDGSNTGDGVYAFGGEVSAPVVISKFEPEYSDEARRAKLSGLVLLSVVVDANGIPRSIHVVRALGLGLDEKAVEAVQRWRFKPGMRHGKPVSVQATVEVSFRLL